MVTHLTPVPPVPPQRPVPTRHRFDRLRIVVGLLAPVVVVVVMLLR